MTNLVCHRGLAKVAPENTIPAFTQAFKASADGIEFDVQLTKDKEIVVCHDNSVNRTSNGKGNIKDMTLKELRELDFGEKFDEKYKGTKIPTLKEVLDISRGFKMINIELKAQGGGDLDLAQRVLFEVRYNKYDNYTVYSSFDLNLVKEMKRQDSNCVTAFIYSQKGMLKYQLAKKYTQFAVENELDYLHPNYQAMDKHYIKNCHEKGIGVNVWGADCKMAKIKLIKAGLDCLTTDDIDSVIKIRDKYIER
ncbi:MAG: hypothetical protein LBH71_01830 [Oscillospiraceae bacterium]|nr:hypothetical protein [Oscillospiraceae bacterium]